MISSLKPFKNIVFDLGGVILNIDYILAIEAFKKIGVANFNEFYSKAQQDRIFDLYETGKISSEEFVEHLLKACPKGTCEKDIVDAWNAMLLDLPGERIDLLNRLRKKYRIFLLSNTNEIHFKAYSQYLEKEFGFSDFSGVFEKEYLSFKIGKRKPNAEVFEYVLKENGLVAHETIFIDDSIQHIEGASFSGIKAFHLKDGMDICNLFKGEI
jgi:glucose-1-phosphatase